MSVVSIPFSQLPDFPKLVADLFAGKTTLEFGFPLKVEKEFWISRSKEEAEFARPREVLVDRLFKQLEDVELPVRTRSNIEALGTPGTLAVVTGQQVGLGGGPLLTLYKALTAIAVAEHLERETGVRTVPVFWMATSDHNLYETAQFHWIDLENRLLSYTPNGNENRTPVGNLKLGDHALQLIHFLRRDLPDNEFKQKVIGLIEECYQPEVTFGQAFQRLGTKFFAISGLVILDPEEAELKIACRLFWEQMVSAIEVNFTHIKARSDEILRAGYTIQAPVEPGRPALFYLEQGARRKIILEGRAKRALSDIIFTRKELTEIARYNPHTLSAGVTVRPLYQSYLLPTGCYVAGPHELAYWAQLSDSFSPLGLYSPAVIHRVSMTIIEKKIKKRLQKLELEPSAFFGDIPSLVETMIAQRSNDSVSKMFEKIRNLSDQCYNELNSQTVGYYAGLNKAVENAFNKITYQMDSLEQKFKQRLNQQHIDLITAMEHLSTHLRPAGKLQERVLSPHYYFSRYGWNFLVRLLKCTRPYNTEHQILDLEEIQV